MEMEDLAPPQSPQAIIQHQPFSPPIHESDGDDSVAGSGINKNTIFENI